MIFVGGGVTVEGNGAQPVDVQTAVFGPEDTRLAIRLETVAGPVQPPHRGRLKTQLSDGLYINQRINREWGWIVKERMFQTASRNIEAV